VSRSPTFAKPSFVIACAAESADSDIALSSSAICLPYHSLQQRSAFFEQFVANLLDKFPPLGVVCRPGKLIFRVLRYREPSNVLFDSELGPLVRVADLTASTSRILHPDEPVSRACEMFSSSKDHSIPVVAREKPHRLLGVVRRRDVLRLLIRGQTNDAGESSA
jgi:CBS domain-containing protein